MAVVLARIESDGDERHGPFTAGVLFINNKVACWAPILKYMAGWTGHEVKAYCDKMGWRVERVEHKYTIVQ